MVSLLAEVADITVLGGCKRMRERTQRLAETVPPMTSTPLLFTPLSLLVAVEEAGITSLVGWGAVPLSSLAAALCLPMLAPLPRSPPRGVRDSLAGAAWAVAAAAAASSLPFLVSTMQMQQRRTLWLH